MSEHEEVEAWLNSDGGLTISQEELKLIQSLRLQPTVEVKFRLKGKEGKALLAKLILLGVEADSEVKVR